MQTVEKANSRTAGSTLRERRIAAGLSQQRLAELAGVSFHMVTMLDNGYAPARSRVRAQVLAVLDTDRPEAA